jgi:hypothetical protein
VGPSPARHLFTTDPNIARSGFVVLDDDRHLQPTENPTAVPRRATSERYGPPPAALVAPDWLRTQGVRGSYSPEKQGYAANGAVHG